MKTAAAIPDAVEQVQQCLEDAVRAGASDVHIEPVADGFEVRRRVDGMLETAERVDAAAGRAMVTRLMVLAQLLTYRLDVPQEGRLSIELHTRKLELRLSIMPTIHGLRAVLRLPADLSRPRALDELLLPQAVIHGLRRFAAADSGMLLITGPAGSGKTTTIYALLEFITAQSGGISVVALEDPVERALPGVTQIQVQPFGELTYERALRSILRQDPQVLMLGEIRDAATASLAVQAALSGHRLISTFHAGTCGGAISRLLDMGIEPYQITSTLFGVVTLRLLRRKDTNGNYRGRIPAAEIALLDDALRRDILARADAGSLDRHIRARPGHIDLRASAVAMAEQGITDESEITRVLGPNV